MLAGLIRDDERRVLEGIPGLIDIPVVGRLFAHSRTETTQTDIILTLTPHIIRVLDLTERDLRSFRVGRDSLAPLAELPLPFDLPRPADSTAPVAAPPATGPPATTPPASIPPPSPRLPGDFN
jgi:general secretion pathway protein D